MTRPLVFGLVAPSGYLAEPDALARASRYLEGQGHRVVHDAAVLHRYQRFAGTDAERLAGLHRMFARADIDVVLAARGGYGLSRLLPGIDFDALAASGKLFVGHSDCTALQLGLLARTGAASLSGPLACFDFGPPEVSAFTAGEFWGALADAPRTIAAPVAGLASCSAAGTLWGGNLTLVAHLAGTPYCPRVDGGILFLEDVGEHPYRIERSLLQLHLAGLLDRQAAILLGQFTGWEPLPNDNGYGLESTVDYLRGLTRTPVLAGLPYGHIRDKTSLPIGARARLEADRDGWRLEIPPPGGPWARLR